MSRALERACHLNKQIDVNDECVALHYSDSHNGIQFLLPRWELPLKDKWLMNLRYWKSNSVFTVHCECRSGIWRTWKDCCENWSTSWASGAVFYPHVVMSGVRRLPLWTSFAEQRRSWEADSRSSDQDFCFLSYRSQTWTISPIS
jgi:hypothetical protein